jgi:hypothetical protein
MKKPPKSFWVIAIVAFLWNIIGVYLSTYQLEVIEQSVSSEEFAIMESLPTWYVSVFIIALLSEVLGCFLLLLRKKLATIFFALSLISAAFIELYWLLATNVTKVSFLLAWVIPIVVIGIAIFLYLYSKEATKKGWLK